MCVCGGGGNEREWSVVGGEGGVVGLVLGIGGTS